MAAGRPPKYEKKFANQLIKHMEEGLSFESFAGEINVARSTLYQWVDDHEEFSDAKKVAFEKSRLFWEKVGIQQAITGVGNATAYVFNMKNRFPDEWKDKQESSVEVTEVVRSFADRE